jgi:ferredoxin
MTYVVTEQCIRYRYTDCAVVCPVDCFHAGPEMLVINPDDCIDCGVCEPECPIDAIKPDTDPLGERWKELNARMVLEWPVITEKTDALADADYFASETGKYEKYLKAPAK